MIEYNQLYLHWIKYTWIFSIIVWYK